MDNGTFWFLVVIGFIFVGPPLIKDLLDLITDIIVWWKTPKG